MNSANEGKRTLDLRPLPVRAQVGEIGAGDTVWLYVGPERSHGAPFSERSEIAALERLYVIQSVAAADKPRNDKEARWAWLETSGSFSGAVDESVIEPEANESSHYYSKPLSRVKAFHRS
jgi:hypothetical protein